MGVKRGTFVTDDGDTIAVYLSGDNISDSGLTLAKSPVILQMDGGAREYKPIQYTTATITCIATGTELFELFTEDPLGVAVTVQNLTTGQCLFSGYVTPNIFNQPLDNFNNAISVECVDWLGISQYVQYVQRDDAQLQTMTVREAVLHIMALITPSATVQMADFITLGESTKNTARYPELELSEAYFFRDPTKPEIEDSGEATIKRNGISCYEALTMIAESFRASFIQFGETVILRDVINLCTSGAQYVYTLTPGMSISGALTSVGEVREITAESFAASGSTVSALRRYSLFSLERTPGETAIIPNIFSHDLLYAKGDRIREQPVNNIEDNTAEVSLIQLLKSRVVSFTNKYSDNIPNPETELLRTYHPSAMFLSQKKITTPIPIDYEKQEFLTNWDDDWANYLRIYKPGIAREGDTADDGDNFVCVSINKEFLVPVTAGKNHSLQIELELGIFAPKDEAGYQLLDTRYLPELTTDLTNEPIRTMIKCGDYYYNIEDGVWTTDKTKGYIDVVGKEWKSRVLSTDTLPDGVLSSDTRSGIVEVSFYFHSNMLNSDKRPTVVYIRKLNLSLIESMLTRGARYSLRPNQVTKKGTYTFNDEYGKVELPISFGFPPTKYMFSDEVEGVVYSQVYSYGDPVKYSSWGKMSFKANGEEYQTIDRVERMASFGDGREFNLILADAQNYTHPLDVFVSQLWSGYKVLMGFQRDVEGNKITVTLN